MYFALRGRGATWSLDGNAKISIVRTLVRRQENFPLRVFLPLSLLIVRNFPVSEFTIFSAQNTNEMLLNCET